MFSANTSSKKVDLNNSVLSSLGYKNADINKILPSISKDKTIEAVLRIFFFQLMVFSFLSNGRSRYIPFENLYSHVVGYDILGGYGVEKDYTVAVEWYSIAWTL